MIVIITLLLRFLLLAIMTPTQGLPALRGHTAHARLAGQVGSLGGEAGVGRGSGRGRRTWVMRNLVRRSGSRPFSLERIISSMSPCSFSITTNTFSGVSNIHSRLTIPGCRRLWGGWGGRGGRGQNPGHPQT